MNDSFLPSSSQYLCEVPLPLCAVCLCLFSSDKHFLHLGISVLRLVWTKRLQIYKSPRLEILIQSQAPKQHPLWLFCIFTCRCFWLIAYANHERGALTCGNHATRRDHHKLLITLAAIFNGIISVSMEYRSVSTPWHELWWMIVVVSMPMWILFNWQQWNSSDRTCCIAPQEQGNLLL